MKIPRIFKVVRNIEDADFETVRVTLFRGTRSGGICGWVIGPAGHGALSDYLPASEELIASSAVLRAMRIAKKTDAEVCIIDPDNLWAQAWGGG